MKVLGLIDHMGLGGAQQVVRDLITEFHPDQVEYDLQSLIASTDNSVARLSESRRYRATTLLNPLHPFRVSRYIAQSRPDVINPHLYVAPFSVAVLPRKWKRMAPVVVTVHTHLDAVPRHVFELFRFFAARGAFFVAVFPNAVPDLLRVGVTIDRITVSGLGVRIPSHCDPAARGHFRAIFGVPEDARVICSFSRLHRQRRLDQLIDAAAQCPPDTWVLIAGDGPDRESLARRAETNGIRERVVFTGRLKSPAALAVASDIVYTISAGGEVGVAAIQLMGLGVPCVALDVKAGRVERPHNSPPILEAIDVHELASGLRILLADCSLHRDLAARSRQWASESCSVEAMVAAHRYAFGRAVGL